MCFKCFGKHKRFYDEIFHFSGDLTLALCLLWNQRTSISGGDDRRFICHKEKIALWNTMYRSLNYKLKKTFCRCFNHEPFHAPNGEFGNGIVKKSPMLSNGKVSMHCHISTWFQLIVCQTSYMLNKETVFLCLHYSISGCICGKRYLSGHRYIWVIGIVHFIYKTETS